MNSEEFNAIVENRIRLIKETLLRKGEEYAPGKDRLANFKRAADLQYTSPKKALGSMVAKQIISLYDMLEVSNSNPWLWNEKITDIINYMILLEALTVEEKQEGQTIDPLAK